MDIQVVLLDIEGTVCPISFVKDVLFPYALSVLPSTLSTEWDSPEFAPYRNAFPAMHRSTPEAFLAHVKDLMSQDLKIPYLKSLQGYLWTQGYTSGALCCPLFPDVSPALHAWHDLSIPIVIYSSGSVPAQKLLFQYTDSKPDADLRGLISGWFDTVNAGLKTEKESYEKIVKTREEESGKWLFLSDNVLEVKAAREAGLSAWVVVREGNKELSESERENQKLIESFEEVKIVGIQGKDIENGTEAKAGEGKSEAETEKAEKRGKGRPKKRKVGEGAVAVDVVTPPKRSRTRTGLRSST